MSTDMTDVGKRFRDRAQRLLPALAAAAAACILAAALVASCSTARDAREAAEPEEQPSESFNLATAGEGYGSADKANVAGSEILDGLADGERDKLLNAVYTAFGDEQVTVAGAPQKNEKGRTAVLLEDSSGGRWWAAFQATKVTIYAAESAPAATADAKDENPKAKTNMRKGVSFETTRAASLDDAAALSKALPEKVAVTLCDKVAKWAKGKDIPMSKAASLADVKGAASKNGKVTMALLLVYENDSNRVTCTYDESANRISLSLD